MIFVVGCATAARAADPPPAPQTVWVVPAASEGAKEFQARLLNLSPESATLLVDGQPREVALSKVARIERRGDSLKNGAIIGAAVLGGLCALTCGQGLDNGSDLAGVVVINAALGAAIGTGIDALHRGRTPIYPAVTGRSRTSAVRPSIGLRVRF
jgi:hypothetical protein